MLKRETRDTTYWLYGVIAVSLINIFFDYSIADRSLKNTDFTSLISLQDRFGLVYAIFLFGSFALVARWIYLAAKANLDTGIEGLKYTPVSSVAWFFVPVMSVWKPYFAVKEQYLARLNCDSFPSMNSKTTFHLWWLAFLASNFLAGIAGRAMLPQYSETYSSGEILVTSSFFSISADIAQILSCLALIKIMRQFTAGEE